MPNSDFLELFKTAKAKCEKCDSLNLLLFTETRIKDCVAWACFDCNAFQVVGNIELIKQFLKNKHDTNTVP